MIDDKNWTQVTESQFLHEKEGLASLRQACLPGRVLRGWTNFEFFDDQGRLYEVDALLLTQYGLTLVELKHYAGTVYVDELTWTRSKDPGRPEKNPLSLATLKCKLLKSRLGVSTPVFVEPLIYLSNPGVRLEFSPASKMQPIYDPSRMSNVINLPVGRQKNTPLSGEAIQEILAKLERIGIVKSRKREMRVGAYVLGKLLGDGPNYQDHEAAHSTLPSMKARIRTYVGKTQAEKERARITAEREFRLLREMRHDNILSPYPDFCEESELGSSLAFQFFDKAVRLDFALANKQVQSNCSFQDRLHIWGSIAEALRYAHQRQIYHRALSPQNVLVDLDKNKHWLVRVFNWQTASALEKTSGTVHITDWLEERFTAYVAPELLDAPNQADASVDLFSLGCIGYFLFTGQDPAANQTELRNSLRTHKGLNIFAVIDRAPNSLAQLITDLTRPRQSERPESIQEFIRRLAEVEKEWRHQEETPDRIKDPTEAVAGDMVAPGCTLVRKLGQGSSSIAFLIRNEKEEELVLKVPLRDGHDRLQQEAEILQLLHDKTQGPGCKRIVELRDQVQWEQRRGIILTSAGPETLAERLASKGPVSLELLQRFGDDLLEMVEFLEKRGMAHRDIKPANLGVRAVGKNDELHLVLFDFSLSREDRRKIEAGTPGYRDPFLSSSRPWDEAAERYAAAVTLYEMCTTRLPQWGDGRVSPSLVDGIEVKLETGDFEPDLHEQFEDFFRTAFSRNVQERFENASEMRAAWKEIFEGAELKVTPATVSLPDGIPAETTLRSLTKKHSQLKQVFDRLKLQTVADLMGLKKATLLRLGNVGGATRLQLGDFYDLVKQRFTGDITPVVCVPDQALEAILQSLVPKKHPFLMEYLRGTSQREWPLASDLAPANKQTEVNRTVREQRQLWSHNSALRELSDDLAKALEELGGAATVDEMCEVLLGLRGALSNEPQERKRMARGVLRALIEVEGMQTLCRFDLFRSSHASLVYQNLELVDGLVEAAKQADHLVQERPLPSTQRCLGVLTPIAKWDYAPAGRLPKLLSALASQARLSSRDEFYPAGMEPLLSLQLCSNALIGREWTYEELQEFVFSRYPEAAALPSQGEVGRLFQQELRLPFGWVESEQKFRPTTANPTSATRTSHTPSGPMTPMNELEARLNSALKAGEPQVLKVRRSEVATVEEWLLAVFRLPTVSLEEKLLFQMLEIARSEGIEARVLWEADRLGPSSPSDWEGLCDIAREAADQVLANLGANVAIKRFSLWGRYGLFPKLSQLIEEASRARPPRTLWLIAPNDEGSPRVDNRPLPIPAATRPIYWQASAWVRQTS